MQKKKKKCHKKGLNRRSVGPRRQRLPGAGRREQPPRLLLRHGAAAARIQPHGRAPARSQLERRRRPRRLPSLHRPRLRCVLR